MTKFVTIHRSSPRLVASRCHLAVSCSLQIRSWAGHNRSRYALASRAGRVPRSHRADLGRKQAMCDQRGCWTKAALT